MAQTARHVTLPPATLLDTHGDCAVCGHPRWRPDSHADWCGTVAAINRALSGTAAERSAHGRMAATARWDKARRQRAEAS